MASSKSRRGGPGVPQSQLRIIGGRWRSRKLAFSPAPGLRPTPDRVRETLFNWLAPVIADANCADLFAGSGALGLEALSRGAAYCDFIDSSTAAIQQISGHLDALGASGSGSCHQASASQYLMQSGRPLDIVFIDPPFDQGLVIPCCKQLAAAQILAPGAYVYIETPAREALTNLPPNWQLHREKAAGGVAFRLYITGG